MGFQTINQRLQAKQHAKPKSQALAAKTKSSALAAQKKAPIKSLAHAKSAMPKPKVENKKFVGFGTKSAIKSALGQNDVASKLAASDTFGLSAEQKIARSQDNLIAPADELRSLFTRPKTSNTIFARDTSDAQKKVISEALAGTQEQLKDQADSNFSNYAELKKDDVHAQEKVADRKVIIDASLFKKR
ncbi:MAG: hypothetical protein LBC33_01935 [Mycoplasmataceae bacterium]|jgi:hypothetical protein|nr:hypothetical protein [Mycoplasmataceae bacterium]